ncbi:MAG: S-adenosylmethionine:tRNA ribosyltransferase-isomerase [Spirosomataceae bacterium]
MLPEVLLADYYYNLPEHRIAHYPVEPRDTSKLLISQKGRINHQRFHQLPDFLPASSLLIFNDTKVIPARLYFQKPTGSVIEIFLLHPEIPTRVINDAMQQTDGCIWSCMIGNKKRWKKTKY